MRVSVHKKYRAYCYLLLDVGEAFVTKSVVTLQELWFTITLVEVLLTNTTFCDID
jgi:hypothetical protein